MKASAVTVALTAVAILGTPAPSTAAIPGPKLRELERIPADSYVRTDGRRYAAWEILARGWPRTKVLDTRIGRSYSVRTPNGCTSLETQGERAFRMYPPDEEEEDPGPDRPSPGITALGGGHLLWACDPAEHPEPPSYAPALLLDLVRGEVVKPAGIREASARDMAWTGVGRHWLSAETGPNENEFFLNWRDGRLVDKGPARARYAPALDARDRVMPRLCRGVRRRLITDPLGGYHWAPPFTFEHPYGLSSGTRDGAILLTRCGGSSVKAIADCDWCGPPAQLGTGLVTWTDGPEFIGPHNRVYAYDAETGRRYRWRLAGTQSAAHTRKLVFVTRLTDWHKSGSPNAIHVAARP